MSKSVQDYTRRGSWRSENDTKRRVATTLRLMNNNQLEETGRVLTESEANLRFAVGRYIHDNSQQQLQMALIELRQQMELLEYSPMEALRQVAETNARLTALLSQANDELSFVRREILLTMPSVGDLRVSLDSFIADDFPRLCPSPTFAVRTRFDGLSELFAHTGTRHTSEKMLISHFVREALRNAYKYSDAHHVEISVSQSYCAALPAPTATPGYNDAMLSGDYVCIRAVDDGRGFDVNVLPEMRARGKHCSVYEFEARASVLGGFCRLISAPGEGTIWELYLPVPIVETTEPVLLERSA